MEWKTGSGITGPLRPASTYNLHVQALEGSQGPIFGNALDFLRVTVIDSPSEGGGTGSSGCLINALMP